MGHDKSLTQSSFEKVHYDPTSDELVLTPEGGRKGRHVCRCNTVTPYQYLGNILKVLRAYIARVQDSKSLSQPVLLAL